MTGGEPTTVEVPLGATIDEALATLGHTPVAAVEVGGWRAGRTTYRVTLADGQVVKVRQLRARNRVQRAVALVRAVDDPRLPPVLAAVGAVTVEAWVEGTVLSSRRPTGGEIDAAADLLADLHALRTLDGHHFRNHQSTAAARARADRHAADLITLGVLTRRDGSRLVERIACGLPAMAARGVTHGDLRPENLVVTASGALRSIDNEAVHIDFLAYDLGRTWSRWPMPKSNWARFRRRYTTRTRRDLGVDEEAAWCIIAALKGAHRWSHARHPSTDAPLRALARSVDAFVSTG